VGEERRYRPHFGRGDRGHVVSPTHFSYGVKRRPLEIVYSYVVTHANSPIPEIFIEKSHFFNSANK